MQLFCIGHKEPAFNPSSPFIHVSPKTVPGLSQIIVQDDEFGGLLHGSVLSEYTQLFGLAKYLETTSKDELLYLFQYRKFLSFKKGANIAANIPYAYAANKGEAESLFPPKDELREFKAQFMVGTHMIMESMLDNYSRGHIADDLLNFAITLRGHSHFSKERCQQFLECKILFPSPAVAIVPNGIFCEHMKILQEAWLLFAPKFYVPRPDYQRRVGGFLLERLHSFLLYEIFFPNIKIPVVEGYQVIVSDSLTVSAS